MIDLLHSTLDHYRILEKLGQGGMGVVYLAEDAHLGRRVALKVLPREMAREPERLRRFQREAKVVAALNHPNIVTLHAVGEASGLHFLIMEYVQGKTLSDLIPEAGLPLAEVLRLAVPLADALRAAHEGGITHRDLKPGNVMVTAEGRPKILDFGLAKLADGGVTALHGLPHESQTAEGRVVGTLAYMTPEQLQGRPADARSDIFSFGAVLYEMATGATPFPAANSAELISAVLRDAPPAFERGLPKLPPLLIDIVRRCLEKSPANRYQTAAELHRALDAAATALRTDEILSSGFGRRARSLLRRVSATAALPVGRRRRVALSSLVLVGALTATGLASLAWRRPSTSPRGTAMATRSAALPGAGRDLPAIAFLPLRNYSGEADYFVDGMSDGLIGALARLKGARVISRTSAMHYKTTSLRLPEIAAELGVDYIAEGSVSRLGDKVRLTVQVVRADPETTLWSGTFERSFGESPALQDMVASAVGQAAGVPAQAAEAAPKSSARAIDPAAYEAYLQGKFYLQQFSEEAQRQAQSYFELAIAKDPNFAPALVGLADSLDWQGSFHAATPDVFRRAQAAAERAVELDDRLSEAHATLGTLHLNRWEWEAAETEIRRAVELDPNSAIARHRLWMWLACQGRPAEALREIELARKLDPLSAGIAADVGIELVFERRFAEGEKILLEALKLDPKYSPTHVYLWLLYSKTAREPERGRELAEYIAGFGWPELRPEIESRLRSQGYEATLRWVASSLARQEEPGGPKTGVVAGLLAESNQADEAMKWLQAGLSKREWTLGWIGVSVDYDSLRSRPDFRALLRALRLPTSRQPGI